MELTTREREILEGLDEVAGRLTRDVASGVTMFGHNARTHSAAVRQWLLDLKERGLVDYLDDQKPVCWKRTLAGTQLIRQ